MREISERFKGSLKCRASCKTRKPNEPHYEHVVRYYYGLNVDGAAFEPAYCANIYSDGIGALKNFLPRYMAVCFGGRSVDEAMDDD